MADEKGSVDGAPLFSTMILSPRFRPDNIGPEQYFLFCTSQGPQIPRPCRRTLPARSL